MLKLLLIHCLCHTQSAADLFTSTADMLDLLVSDQNIPNLIDSVVEQIEDKLEDIKRISSERKLHNQNPSDDLKLISNPISAYRFIKNLANQWRQIEQWLTQNFGTKIFNNVPFESFKFPTEEDVSGAALAVLRLQDTYNLDAKDIADGKIRDTKVQPLSALECFEIGREAYNDQNYHHTIIWMTEARERLTHNRQHSAGILADILEYLAFSLYKQGNLKRAYQMTEQLHQIAPDHPRAANNLRWYEDLMEEQGIKRADFRRKIPPLLNPRNPDGMKNSEREIYQALCRDQVTMSTKETSRLYCYYKKDRDYLRLAPVKVEIMRFNPLVVLFRNVISDEEIEMVKALATPRLRRATVQNSKTGELETASYRISKSAWLKDQEHEVVNRINRRIDLMTNLEQETAEELQIANYGIGGHYDPHFDFARQEEVRSFESLGTGNRLATVLFYLSQPEMGGATVFTELKTTVMPSKNDALFWYNLLRSGKGDLRTRHAACPVLIGIKWVANKWIHERGQEFRRPCGLKISDAENFVGQL